MTYSEARNKRWDADMLGGKSFAEVCKAATLRVGPGVVGNTTRVAVVALILSGVAIGFLNKDVLSMFLMVLLVLLFAGFFVIYISRFAASNPYLALTDGADYRQLIIHQTGARNLSNIPELPAIEAPPDPLQMSVAQGGKDAP